MNIICTTEIKAPAEAIFEFIEDHRKTKRWMRGLLETSYPDGYNYYNPVGARFVQKVREFNREVVYNGEITGYHKPNYYKFIVNNSYIKLQIELRLHSNGSGTKLIYSIRVVDGSVIAKISFKFFSLLSRQIALRHITSLKKLAEAEMRYREINSVIREERRA